MNRLVTSICLVAMACLAATAAKTTDNPLPPTNAHATLSDDGTMVTVSWDVPGSVGENGGFVEVDRLTYYIFDAYGSFFDPAIAVTTETSYTFDYSDINEQDFKAYQITCGIDETYYSLDTSTNIVVVGQPMQMPFAESFAGGKASYVWAIDPATTRSVTCGTVNDNNISGLPSHDGDNGYYVVKTSKSDDLFGMLSIKTSMIGAQNPVLDLYYYGRSGDLDVLIAAGAADFELARSIDLSAEPTDGWTLCRIDLDTYKTAPFVMIELRIRANGNPAASIAIDDISIRDLIDHDLRVKAITIAPRVAAPADVPIAATIENCGTQPSAAGAIVELLRDGTLITTAALDAMEPGSSVTVDFTDTIGLDADDTVTYTATVRADIDDNRNNDSMSTTLTVTMPQLATVTNLQATVDEGIVTLTWEPVTLDSLQSPTEVTEDFECEDYPLLTISSFGPWTLYDADGRRTYTILSDFDNPHRNKPMAWQLYNPEAAGVPASQLLDADPHSGGTMLVAWSAVGSNSNWLISPQLSGSAQEVTFWARSFTIAYYESFTVYYSTTDAQPSSFKAEALKVRVVPEQWTEYSAMLPDGARYFAIVHDANDTYAMYLDDITYIAAPDIPSDLQVEGYNVYRNGLKITDTPTAEATYTDRPEVDQLTLYRVSTVYSSGESRLCPAVEVTVTSGVETVSIDAPTAATYYTIDGRRVADTTPPPGLYIRVDGHKATKVLVR